MGLVRCGSFGFVVDRLGSLWIVLVRCGSVWFAVDRLVRFGYFWFVEFRHSSLWIIFVRCGSFWFRAPAFVMSSPRRKKGTARSLISPLSQVVFSHPFPLRRGGWGVVSTSLLMFAN